MSLERAYKNCQICYEVRPIWNKPHGQKVMNDAMDALEEEIPSDFRSDNVTMVRKRLAYEALKVCANCNYEKAGLVEFLEKELPKTFTPEKKEESK